MVPAALAHMTKAKRRMVTNVVAPARRTRHRTRRLQPTPLPPRPCPTAVAVGERPCPRARDKSSAAAPAHTRLLCAPATAKSIGHPASAVPHLIAPRAAAPNSAAELHAPRAGVRLHSSLPVYHPITSQRLLLSHPQCCGMHFSHSTSGPLPPRYLWHGRSRDCAPGDGWVAALQASMSTAHCLPPHRCLPIPSQHA